MKEKDRELEDTRRHLVDKDADVAKLQNMHHRYEAELVRATVVFLPFFIILYMFPCLGFYTFFVRMCQLWLL